ncbi:HlyD family secretion protein [Xanthobacter dioxanivorans]|uniref:HlyD family secretion protein n=1 Tax=Xanthobacter dioxanivorans TaxID=2528964 RepID=A0A974PQH6_9HYPH|nr:HlyD family secretion protein [Xanthobacter dioxanivorans]QRG07873.1 HlyD family secretion protein [Xanthobacter dioxanivorans]
MNIAVNPSPATAKRVLPSVGPTDAPPLAPPPAAQRPARSRFRLLLVSAAGLLALCGLAYAGFEYWTSWRFEQTTDDAYVQADVVTIAPKVSGYLRTVEVNDNQPVKAGDILATIDPRDYEASVNQALADVTQATASIANFTAQIAEQQALIDEARATIDVDQAAELYAEQNDKRYATLANAGYGSIQNAQQAASAGAQAKAALARDKAALLAAQKQVDTLKAQLEQAKATLAHNEAVLDQAQLNLGYTKLRAPVDGVVGARTLRVGQFVQPGTQLLALVPLQATYIVANYKETQLTDVRRGQPVSISVDTFPGTSVRGVVNSVAPASGQEFALLPPDNATGNFTKIVQRIPVKVTIDRADPLAGRLLPGMSVTTTISVREQPRPPAAALDMAAPTMAPSTQGMLAKGEE